MSFVVSQSDFSPSIFSIVRLLPCFFLLVTWASLAAQGPISGFRTPKGEVAIALSYSTDNYDTYLLPDGEEDRLVEATSYSLFIEAGTGDRTSLVFTLPYISTDDANSSLQDASLWLKYANQAQRKGRVQHNIFTAIGLTVPVGDYPVDNQNAIGQQATVFQGRLVYQLQHDLGWFVSAVSGIDFQFAPESRGSWPLLLRAGYGGPYFYVEGWFEIIRSLEGGVAGQTAVAGTGSSWNRVGATLYVPITNWFGASAGGAWITGGEFIGASDRLNLGIIFNLGRKASLPQVR